MVGPKRNQEFNKIIEPLERYFIKIKQDLNNQISSIKLILIDDSIVLDDGKISTLFIRLYRYARYKCYKIKQEYEIGTFTLKKKTLALTSACLLGATSSFIFLFNGDLIRTDVSAQTNTKTQNLSKDYEFEFPTLSINGQRFATDARIVSKQLSNYDFYNDGNKVVYLTFDDGPTKYTKDILNILKKYNVRATFFTTGTALENGGPQLSKVLKESYTYGNSIGNHTYSHDYKTLYPNGSLDLQAFNNDLERNLTLLRNSLGESFDTNIIRCPGGYNSWKNMEPLKNQLEANNKAYIDWNALTGDSSSKNDNPKQMLTEAFETSKDKNLVVLLMHETNKYTPEYLDDIIRYYHTNGYEFRTLA